MSILSYVLRLVVALQMPSDPSRCSHLHVPFPRHCLGGADDVGAMTRVLPFAWPRARRPWSLHRCSFPVEYLILNLNCIDVYIHTHSHQNTTVTITYHGRLRASSSKFAELTAQHTTQHQLIAAGPSTTKGT